MKPQEADSAAAALDLLRRGAAFDLAVLDMHMPGVDGAMLAREIRGLRSEAELPLVLCSSLGQRSPDGLFAAALTKPVKPTQLADALVRVLAGRGPVAAPAAPAPAATTAAATATARPGRLLLAEDNPVNQKVALHMLRSLGRTADAVANGLEVLEAVRRQRYDVILLDVQMPEMDGLEVAARLVQDYPAPAARPWMIALTANAMQGDRDRCLRREWTTTSRSQSRSPTSEPPSSVRSRACGSAARADWTGRGGRRSRAKGRGPDAHRRPGHPRSRSRAEFRS